jgi:tape measure domain-containing protein
MAVNAGVIETTLTADVRQFTTGMRRAEQQFGRTARMIQDGTTGGAANMRKLTAATQATGAAVNSMASTFRRSMALIGAAWIVPSLFGAANSAIMGFNQQLDSARIAMKNFVGEGAEDLLEQLQLFGARTPFNFKDLLGTSQQMLAMGVAADELIPRLTAIGDAAAAMGGSPMVLNRIQRALGQIQAKGRAQAEELLQLAEAGIPAYEYIATLAGGSIPDALDMMRKGQVDATTAINAILDGMSRDFGGMMEEQSKTMEGATSNVQDFIEMTIGALGRPLFEAVRDSMLAISKFLSSPTVEKGATIFAENFSNALKVLGELGSSFGKTIGPAIVASLDMAKEAARSFFNGLNEMKMILAPLAAAVMALAGGLRVLSSILTPLLTLIADNKNAAALFASVMIVLIARSKLLGVNAAGNARSLQKLVNAFTSAKASAGAMSAQVRATNATFRSTGQSATVFKTAVMTSMAGAKAAVVSFMASTGVLLAVSAAVMGAVKAFTAFKDRNKDANERTKELTASLKDNTAALLENKEALLGGADGADLLAESILGATESGDKIRRSFGQLGTSASVKTFLNMADNFDDVALSMLKAKGVNDDYAESILLAVNEIDKQNDSISDYVRSLGEQNGMTEAAINDAVRYARALEEIQDQLENINLDEIVRQQAEMLIGSGQLTSAQLEQANALAQEVDGYDSMGLAMQQATVHQMMMKVASDALRKSIKEQADAVAAYSDVDLATLGSTIKRVEAETLSLADAFDRLTAAKDESGVVAEQYIAALLKEHGVTVALNRALFDLTSKANGFMDSVANLDGSTRELTGAGFQLFDQFVEIGVAFKNMGKTAEEAFTAQKALIETFIASAEEAGYSRDQIDELVKSLGILDALSPNVRITLDIEMEQALADLNEALMIMADIGSLGGPGGAMDGMLSKITELQQRIASLGDNTGRQFTTGIRREDTTASRDLERQIEEEKKALERHLTGLIGVGEFALSDTFAQSLLGSPEDIENAFEALMERAVDAGMHKIPELQQALKAMLEGPEKADLLRLSLENAELVKSISEQRKALVDARAEQARLRTEANAFDATLYARDKEDLELFLDNLASKQQLMADAERELAQLESKRKGFTERVAGGISQNITTGRGGVMYQATKILEHARKFKGYIKDLIAKDFPPDIINQVLGMGAMEGGILARRLLALSPSDLAEFKGIFKEIGQVGQDVADIAASVFFDADVVDATSKLEAQKSLVRSAFQAAVGEADRLASEAEARLTGQEEMLEKNNAEMKRLAEVIQIDFANTLKEYIEGLGPLSEEMQAVFDNFLSEFEAVITGIPAAIAAILAGFTKPGGGNIVPAAGSSPSAVRKELKEIQKASPALAKAAAGMASTFGLQNNTLLNSLRAPGAFGRLDTIERASASMALGALEGATAARQTTNNITVNTTGDGAEIAREVVTALNQFQRRNGDEAIKAFY